MTKRVAVLTPRELIMEIVKAMVDHPEKVVCREIQGTHTCILELDVAKRDIGKVIGRKGIHAEALRRILHAASGRLKMRYTLELNEDR